MATPTSTLVSLRADLSTFFQWSYEEAQEGFIGGQVLRFTPVAKQAGQFSVRTLESMTAGHGASLNRASGSGYTRMSDQFSTQNYATTEKGIEEPVDERDMKIYTELWKAEEYATKRLINTIMTQQEQRVATAVMNVAFYTGNSAFNQAPFALWSVHATATPITDVKNAKVKFRTNNGMKANALIMSYRAFLELQLCQQIIDRIAASGAGDRVRPEDITVAQLEECFGLRVLVGDGMANTANPNLAATMTDIWPVHVLVARIAETDDFSEPSIGRILHWAGDDSEIDGHVESYEEPQTRSTVIRARHETAELITYQRLGVMITTVL